ncbi:MAG: hypothetical protein QG636_377 [Patescibacteria group bacterium]|nr:hypothetical protein [Patescibacteria group bacterium]
MNTSPSETGKRPVIISIICVVGFLGGILSLAGIIIPASRAMLVESYGMSFVILTAVLTILTFASLIGFWKMKKWGLYTYIVATVLGMVGGLYLGLPFNVLSYIVPTAIVVTGLFYFKRFR